MYNIRLNEIIKNYCWKLVNKKSFGNRGFADGNKIEQYTGILGECTMDYEIGGNFPSEESGYDGGHDLIIKGKKIDIKTMGRTVYPRLDYVNNFLMCQLHFDCQVYIFCSINKKESFLTVCGICTKEQLIKNGQQIKSGEERTRADGTKFKVKSDMMEIRNDKLFQVNNRIELINYLERCA